MGMWAPNGQWAREARHFIRRERIGTTAPPPAPTPAGTSAATPPACQARDGIGLGQQLEAIHVLERQELGEPVGDPGGVVEFDFGALPSSPPIWLARRSSRVASRRTRRARRARVRGAHRDLADQQVVLADARVGHGEHVLAARGDAEQAVGELGEVDDARGGADRGGLGRRPDLAARDDDAHAEARALARAAATSSR
jgi:hypothetical protein